MEYGSGFYRPWDLDRYGGLLEGPNFDATGFFRAERRDGLWWLVTPDGRGFFSLGIDVVRPDVGATFVEGREFMITGPPELGDPLAARYGYADDRSGLPAQRGRQCEHGRSFDFYAANVQRKYGETTWRSGVIRRSSGCGSGTSIRSATGASPGCSKVTKCRMPCRSTHMEISRGLATARIGGERCRILSIRRSPRLSQKAASTDRDDPHLIGYFVDNKLGWGLGNAVDPRLRYGLAVETLRLGATSPAKLAFVAQLTEKYRDAEYLARCVGHCRAIVG
jgi:hypothetical protein